MSKRCLGLDIGSSHTKLVELSGRRSSVQLISANMISTPAESCLRGKVLNRALLTETIKNLIAKTGTKTERVVLGINSPDVMIKTVTYPKMPDKELEQALDFEIDQIFKLSANVKKSDLIISFDKISETTNEINLLVVCSPKSLITPYIEAIKGAGLVPFIIDIGAFSLPRVSDSKKRRCYVDLGHSQTVIYIAIDGVYQVYRILPIGGRDIDQGIMESFDVDASRSEKFKFTHDIDYLLLQGVKPSSLMRATVQQYVGGILQTLDYFRAQYRSSSISEVLDQVVLCGGNALIAGIDELLQEEIGIEVEVLNPFSRLQIDQLLPKDGSIYGGAVGLALRGLEAP